MGCRGGRVPVTCDGVGLSLDDRRSPDPAAPGVRLEPRDDRPRRLAEPALLRPRRAVRRGADRAGGCAARRRDSARGDRGVGVADDPHDRDVAALSALGLVNGLATGAVSVPLAAIIANRWFIARRGLVTGLMTASYASGQLVFLPALAWLAGFDWRWAALAIATSRLLGRPAGRPSGLCVTGPGTMGWRRTARRGGLGAPPVSDCCARIPVRRSMRFPLAMRSQTFWLLAGTFFVCGATTNGLVRDAPHPGGTRSRDRRRSTDGRRCSR